MSSPIPKVKRTKANKIKELVEDEDMSLLNDASAQIKPSQTTAETEDAECKSPVVKKRELKVPGAPKSKRKAEKPDDFEQSQVIRSNALGCDSACAEATCAEATCAAPCAAAPKKQRAKKPKVAGYMSSVNNDHVLFKTHKEAYDYWRNQQGQGENNGGIYECDYGKTLEFLK